MLTKLLSFLGQGKDPAEARALYAAIVAQSRQAAFYQHLGVPDSLDGRFDMIVLHAYLVLRRLRTMGPAGEPLSQALFDLIFADMDANLREIGVGDLSVGKRIKAMAQAFFGRVAAYDAALDGSDGAALEAALRRNLYGTRPDIPEGVLPAMARYLAGADRDLKAQPDSDILLGKLTFLPAPVPQPGD